jgi:iron-sulfur cluster assembly accessory protein
MSTAASPLTPMTPTGEANKPLLTLTDAAIEKVKYFAKTMPDSTDKPLRIFVQGGGCSGFQYGFQFDEKKEGDNVIEQGGISVLVDTQRATYLKDGTFN